MSNWPLLTLITLLVACGFDSRVEDEANRSSETATNSDVQTTVSQSQLAAVKSKAFDAQVPQARTVKVALRDTLGEANMCAGAITHADRVGIPPVAKPPFKRYYKDPAFGSRVIRITNSKFGDVFKPPYSTMQSWNADESLMLLYKGGKDAYHLLLDGHTYEPVRKLDIIPADIEEVFWSHSDPDAFFYVSKYSRDYGLFKKYSVKAGKAKVIADFGKFCGAKGLPTGGGDIHMQSHDDDLFGFRCRKDDSSYIMMSYRISTNEVVTQKIGKGTEWEEWTAPIPAPSGERFWFQGKALGPDLKTVEKSLDMKKFAEHSSVGLTHNGQDALFQTVFDPSPGGCQGDLWQGVGHLVEHNLETGTCRPIINEAQGYPYTTSGTHVSAQAYLRPGWVAMSSIGFEEQFEFFSNNRKAPALLSEIYLANTDPDKQVTCRLAHHRSFGKMAKKGGYPPYFGEPHATLSPSGTRIVFGSDWYDSGSVDSYVIELPGYQAP